jgi:hypothetical protein
VPSTMTDAAASAIMFFVNMVDLQVVEHTP